MDEQLSAPVGNPAIHGKPRLRRKRSTELKWKVDTTRGRQRFRVEGVYVDGKRTRRYFRTQREAETFIEAEQVRRANLGSRAQNIDGRLLEDAVEAERLLAAEGLSVMSAVREYLAARSILRPFPGASLLDAADHYAKLLGDRHRSWTVDEAAEAWTESRVAKGCSQFYLVDAKRRLQRFRDTFGTSSMADVQDTAIERWVAALGLGPQSQRNFLTVISGLFSFAVAKGKAPANPCERIERPKVVADEPGILTPAELRRLLNHLPVDTVPYVVIGAFAGLRPQEIRRLDWSGVNFETGLITVRSASSKTRRRRTVEMPANLVAWLRPLAQPSGPVVALADLTVREKRLKPARAAAGLGSLPHDWARHSAASYSLALTENSAKVALAMGHDETVLHAHYKGLTTRAAAEEWFSILPPEAVAARASVIVRMQT